MSKSNVNVIVHVKQDLDRADLGALQASLVNVTGVVRAQPSKRLGRMMLVDYDPSVVSAQTILERVRGRGLEAQLVGM